MTAVCLDGHRTDAVALAPVGINAGKLIPGRHCRSARSDQVRSGSGAAAPFGQLYCRVVASSPAKAPVIAARRAQFFLVWTFVGAVWVHIFRVHAHGSADAWKWSDVGWGFAGVWVGGLFGAYVHVGAHAVTTVGSGLRLRSLAAGGTAALRLTIRGTTLRLGPFPWGEGYGFASGRAPLTFIRYRRVVRAGPVASLLLVALAVPVIVLASAPFNGLALAFALRQLDVGLGALRRGKQPKSDGALLYALRHDPLHGSLADLVTSLCLDGQFKEAAEITDELASALAQGSAEAAELRSLQADCLLSAALQAGHDLEPETQEWCARWIDADSTVDLGGAITHRRSLLELARGNFPRAAALCLDAVARLDKQQNSSADAVANRNIAVGTLSIAYARSGDVAEAQRWLGEVGEGSPLHDAALRELNTAPFGSH
jgi:hypothetical protein